MYLFYLFLILINHINQIKSYHTNLFIYLSIYSLSVYASGSNEIPNLNVNFFKIVIEVMTTRDNRGRQPPSTPLRGIYLTIVF